MILPHIADPHPRVRWAVCNTLGQMFTDFGPTIQSKYHAKALPAIFNVMDDKDNPRYELPLFVNPTPKSRTHGDLVHLLKNRVQSHAASAIINFAEHATNEILEPYLNTLMSKFSSMMQGGNKMVLEQVITATAAVADVIEEKFTPFYDSFMPFLKQVLVNANGKEYRMLRGKAMECITLIGVAVGKEKFYADAKEVCHVQAEKGEESRESSIFICINKTSPLQIVQVLYAAQQTPMEPDDPLISFLLQAWARVCKALGQEFVPYLDVVMPPLLRSAALNPDLTVQGDGKHTTLES